MKHALLKGALAMSLKRVGGIHFWTFGPFGGSFHMRKGWKAPTMPRVDTTGLALCTVLFIPLFWI